MEPMGLERLQVLLLHLPPLSSKQQEAVLRIDLLAGIQAVLIGEHEVEDAGSLDDLGLDLEPESDREDSDPEADDRD